VTPDRNVAFLATGDFLPSSGLGGGVDYFGLCGESCDVAGFYDSVEGEGGAGFVLAPCGVSLLEGWGGEGRYSDSDSSAR
jgi:hypothetical protein